MNPSHRIRFFFALGLLATPVGLRAADPAGTNLNLPLLRTNALPAKPAKPTAAERRAKINAWRKEHSGLEIPEPTNAPRTNPAKLSPDERRARIKAQLAGIQQQPAASNSVLVTPPTNPPAAK